MHWILIILMFNDLHGEQPTVATAPFFDDLTACQKAGSMVQTVSKVKTIFACVPSKSGTNG